MNKSLLIVRLLKYCKILSVKCIISVLGGLNIALIIVDLLGCFWSTTGVTTTGVREIRIHCM